MVNVNKCITETFWHTSFIEKLNERLWLVKGTSCAKVTIAERKQMLHLVQRDVKTRLNKQFI